MSVPVSSRVGEYAVAAVVAVFATVASPLGIEMFTGRADLSFRVTAASWMIVAFLLGLSGALAAQPRLRRYFFPIVASTLPFALLAGLEFLAIAFRLADRIAPLEDTSILMHADRWPGYLMSDARWQSDRRLYRPWNGPGVRINALGLRTAAPTPKKPGEWRIAVTGGSAVWGWRVLDADTISVQLQQIVRVTQPNVTVYSFGIEGATLSQELAVLKEFRDAYGIDQAVFYTGANDVFAAYLDGAGARKLLIDSTGGWMSFELVKATTRFSKMNLEPSVDGMQPIAHDRLQRSLEAAEHYCDTTRLACDFLLQPLLFTRTHPAGTEIRLTRTFRRLYPGFGQLAFAMYHKALGTDATGRVRDLSDMFDSVAQPVFTDNVHVNEQGNRIAAEHIAATVSFGPK